MAVQLSGQRICGLKVTMSQMARIQAVCEDPKVVKTRKVITMHGSNVMELALFRVQATNNLAELAVRGVLKRPMPRDLKRYVEMWAADGNPMFREHFEALNEALGYEYIDLPLDFPLGEPEPSPKYIGDEYTKAHR